MSNYSSSALRFLSSENEVAVVLSHFNSSYILDVIQDKLNSKFLITTASIESPNIVDAFRSNFIAIASQYPFDEKNITICRDETYREILDIICRNYGIEWNRDYVESSLDPAMSLYSFAHYVYDFFVSNFSTYISLFFARYIYANRTAIYNSLNLDQFKRSKDSSTMYGKRAYDDPYIGIISTNIIYVIDNMIQFDVSFHDILTTIYGDQNVVNLLINGLGISYDFFRNVYYAIPPEFKPNLITNIRLDIQRIILNDMSFQNAFNELNN